MLSFKEFTEIYTDKSMLNFKKMYHKYGNEKFSEFIEGLKESFYKDIYIKDFSDKKVKILFEKINNVSQLGREFFTSFDIKEYGIDAMEDEIISTLFIESIKTSRESVRKILNGGAPDNDNESKAYGIKKGLDFTSNLNNIINAENLYKLYKISINDYLDDDNKLKENNFYRSDEVFVVGDKISHQGLKFSKLNEYMSELIKYINEKDDMDHILKSIILHYYFGYIHPYFDGNGRMARLLQMWYLIQNGYSKALYIPFSYFINENKEEYYKAFDRVKENLELAGILDITPFIIYFIENVLKKIENKVVNNNTLDKFAVLVERGIITPKEIKLFEFVISFYGNNEFSTKTLEKDYRNSAYATIRTFVLKLTENKILKSSKYGGRIKYSLIK